MPTGRGETRPAKIAAKRWSAPKLLVASLLAVACSNGPAINARDAADANDTGATLLGRTEQERTLLRELPRLPTGPTRSLAGLSVTADAPYPTASGRTCRALHLRATSATTGTDRLACTEGAAWFFVPDVFGAAEPKE